MNKISVCIALVGIYLPLVAQQKPKRDSLNETQIKEVIITSSYGTKKIKEEVVGSIITLTSKEVNMEQPFESLEKMLIGIAPGVEIVNTTELAKPININIRGLGSMVNFTKVGGTSTQPLIIIDGVIMREDMPFDALGFNGTVDSEMNINPLARISTDNIETINILKDAAAVALYGADAANGVILITTKRGRTRKPTFSISTQYGVSMSINKMKYLSGEQYAKLRNTYNINTGAAAFVWNGNDVDWFEVMNRNSSFYKTNFATSGIYKIFNYRFGVDYSKNEESKVNNDFQKKGIDATLGIDLGKFKASLYSAYNEIDKNQPNTYFNFILAPDIPVYDANGDFMSTGYTNIPNPLAAATQNIINLKNKSLLSSLNASYDFNKNLKLSTIFGLDYSDKEETKWYSGRNESGRQTGSFTMPDGRQYPRWGRSILNYSDAFKWNWSMQLYYQKVFAEKHSIDTLLGGEIRSNKDIKNQHSGSRFINPFEYQLPWDAAVYINTDGKQDQNYIHRRLTNINRGRSLFSQVNYDYDKRYYLSATIRRDESSAFGRDVNAAYNGAIGLSWVVSNERFMKNKERISFLRLRTSWGMTGNSRIGSYRSAGLYNISQNGTIYGGSYATPDTSSPSINTLGWEKNEKYNIGLDISLFNGKASFTIEAYRNNISDMIVRRDAPPETGYGSAEMNGAEMYNQGLEFSTNLKWFSGKKFRWNTHFNISTLTNKVTALRGFGDDYSISSLARAQRIGHSTSALWGYQYAGIDSTTGRYQYLTNRGIIKTTPDNNPLEYSVIGDTQPDAIGGLNNTISYKNFNLSFNLSFQIGGDVLIDNEYIDKFTTLINRNKSVNALDFWSVDNNTNATIQKPDRTLPRPNSSKYVYDKTHIHLRNINLSYKIPTEKYEKKFLKDAYVFVDVTNVFYWYKQKSPSGRNGIREFRYFYPEMRTFSFGFKMNF